MFLVNLLMTVTSCRQERHFRRREGVSECAVAPSTSKIVTIGLHYYYQIIPKKSDEQNRVIKI